MALTEVWREIDLDLWTVNTTTEDWSEMPLDAFSPEFIESLRFVARGFRCKVVHRPGRDEPDMTGNLPLIIINGAMVAGATLCQQQVLIDKYRSQQYIFTLAEPQDDTIMQSFNLLQQLDVSKQLLTREAIQLKAQVLEVSPQKLQQRSLGDRRQTNMQSCVVPTILPQDETEIVEVAALTEQEQVQQLSFMQSQVRHMSYEDAKQRHIRNIYRTKMLGSRIIEILPEANILEVEELPEEIVSLQIQDPARSLRRNLTSIYRSHMLGVTTPQTLGQVEQEMEVIEPVEEASWQKPMLRKQKSIEVYLDKVRPDCVVTEMIEEPQVVALSQPEKSTYWPAFRKQKSIEAYLEKVRPDCVVTEVIEEPQVTVLSQPEKSTHWPTFRKQKSIEAYLEKVRPDCVVTEVIEEPQAALYQSKERSLHPPILRRQREIEKYQNKTHTELPTPVTQAPPIEIISTLPAAFQQHKRALAKHLRRMQKSKS